MKYLIPLCIFSLTLFSGCASEKVTIAPEDCIPISLEAFIGSYFFNSYSKVTMISPTRVLYEEALGPGREKKSLELEVAPEAWREFREAIEKAHVFSWEGKYIDDKICDGTQWSFRVKYKDKELDIYGSNKIPNKTQFKKFLDAISALAHKKPFQ